MCDKSRKRRMEFESVADFFLAERRDGWFPDEIQFERCTRFVACGYEWGITCALGLDFGGLQATVMINPEDGRRNPARIITPKRRSGVYRLFDGIVRKMHALGYEGSWVVEPFSPLPRAHFFKPLRNIKGIEREHRLLSRLEFGNGDRRLK